MEGLFEWLSVNQSWLFKGIGTAAVLGIVGFFFKKKQEKSSNKPVVNTANGDGNYQAGRDIIITKEKKT